MGDGERIFAAFPSGPLPQYPGTCIHTQSGRTQSTNLTALGWEGGANLRVSLRTCSTPPCVRLQETDDLCVT
jgi:hypothetical protein